ncbi:calcium-dependent phosphotriesterase [Venturia nashicola]|uniref:Calcium-dependent phosphotriesterase n=1 Tax=Venturia nashicola TaxID=86259 RepID=A0A4Z1NMS9_9PEZI|nr:calcium-dependent phosphotriesterase [Venturia nashicola]TLD21849.1 calcium-dependent phosphotriesterase [Venturia nashicola]
MHLRYIASTALLAVANASPTNNLRSRQQANNLLVSIPQEWTYKLPPTFQGNFSTDFVRTNTTNRTVDSTLLRARSSPFISYSDEFQSLVGGAQRFRLVSQNTSDFAAEAGVWVPETNQVWFTSSLHEGFTYTRLLDLNTSTILTPNTSLPLPAPNGGYYFNGLVYITAIGTETLAGGIYSINPIPDATGTYQTEIVVNSYYGVRFNGADDVTWSLSTNTNGTKKPLMFFTDVNFRFDVPGYTDPVGLPNAVWRFDPTDQLLEPVIPQADIATPNGIRVNKDFTILYVTDSTRVNRNWGSPSIYQYDLTSDGYPTNKKLLSFARRGLSDGIHIDDAGRIWTAEYEGVVVRSPNGRVLGIFNSEYFLEGDAQGNAVTQIANFALANDTLVILAQTRIWTVNLGQVLIDPVRYRL